MVVLAVLAGTVWCWKSYRREEIEQPPGLLIPDEPIQIDFPPTRLTTTAGWSLDKLATFHIHARVLHVKYYGDDRSSLSPCDLLLGWGRMSDTEVLSKLNFGQGARMFFYDPVDSPSPISDHDVICHVANVHVIPADLEVASFMKSLRIGELVNLRGSLVSAEKNGVTWVSSLTRWDTGAHSSELLFTTDASTLRGKQALIAEESARGMDEARSSLQSWYEILNLRRRTLDPRDQKAVRAYNEEAALYMTLAHPNQKFTPPPATP